MNELYAASEPERQKRNAKLRETAMARKPDITRKPPEGYAFGTIESGMAEMFGVMADEMAREDARRAKELGSEPAAN
jgi:hypothetical protein